MLQSQANAGPQVLDVTLSLGDEEISRRIEQKLYEDRLREAREERRRGKLGWSLNNFTASRSG